MSLPSRFGVISSPAALLSELQRFSRTSGGPRRTSWPLALPAGDASALISGNKPLLALQQASSSSTPTTPFNFKCTGCGDCCKTLPAAVRIDIIDAWRMTKMNPTMGLFPLNNFARAVGLFDRRALIEGGIAARVMARISMRLNQVRGALKNDNGAITETSFGTAPITFLRPSPKTSRCGFALDAAHGGLTCSLSSKGMPLTCSLYPLGHFLHADMRVDGSSTHFFTVDEKGCEGVVKRVKGNSTTTTATTTTANNNNSEEEEGVKNENMLEAYASRNGLLPRYHAAEWSRGLSTAWACSGIEAHAAAAGGSGISSLPTPSLIALRERIRKVWETPRVTAGVESNPDAEWNDSAATCLENATVTVAETYWNTTIREGREYT